MSKFSLIAMGGTFDIIHRGHLTLLSNAFEISDNVIIGLTSDEFAAKKGKTPNNKYAQRLENLITTISKEFPNTSFEISKLDNDFGPAVLEPDVEALVVSDETRNQGDDNSDQIPSWLKTTVGYWADDVSSDGEFVNAIKFLIENGLMKISN